jgi:glycosyltransferase involved in cell wall biosynthesis
MYGAEAVLLNLSRALNEAGHESVLGVFENSAQPNVMLYEVARAVGIESYTVPCRGQVDGAMPAAIRELVARVRADVVHAHGYKADVYVWLALRGRGVPIISTCHNWLDSDLATRVYGWLDRSVLRDYDGVVAVSAAVRERLVESGVRESAVRVIRNGIDSRGFRMPHLPQECPVVGLAGRLSREKGVDVFLTMAAEVLVEWPMTRFVVAGDGPEKEALETMMATLGIGGSVSLLGRQEDMAGFYGSLDILVSSSRTEGLPMGLLEGMASGLPVVATAVGDVPCVVDEGVTGFLVDSEDVEGLAARVLRLLRTPGLRRTMGEAGRRRVDESFSAAGMAEAYLEMYREMYREATAE